MTDEVRNEPAQLGKKVQLANDPQIQEMEIRKNEGIPIEKVLIEEFKKLTNEIGIKMLAV